MARSHSFFSPAETASGTTLAELSLAMLLISILVGLSSPNIRHLNTLAQSTLTLQRLSKAVESAKVSAISSGEIVTLCGSEDSRSCQGKWSEGVLSFIDRNGNRELDNIDQPLNWQSMKDIEGVISWKAFGNRQYLLMDPQGMMGTQNGSFTYCTEEADHSFAVQLVINRTARARMRRDLDPLDYCHNYALMSPAFV